MVVLVHPLLERRGGQGAAAGVRKKGLLRRGAEDLLVGCEQMLGQRGYGRWWLADRSADRRDQLSIAPSLVLVWTATMDLEIGVRMGAVEHGLRRGAVDVGVLVEVSARLGGIEVCLAFLQVFDLAGGVLGPREAAMQTSHLCTLCRSRLAMERRGWREDKHALEGESVSWNSAKARRMSGLACPVYKI